MVLLHKIEPCETLNFKMAFLHGLKPCETLIIKIVCLHGVSRCDTLEIKIAFLHGIKRCNTLKMKIATLASSLERRRPPSNDVTTRGQCTCKRAHLQHADQLRLARGEVPRCTCTLRGVPLKGLEGFSQCSRLKPAI